MLGGLWALGPSCAEEKQGFPSLIGPDEGTVDVSEGPPDTENDSVNPWNLPGGGLAGTKPDADGDPDGDGPVDPCLTGAINGVLCTSDLPLGTCLSLSADLVDCHGNAVTTPQHIAVGGGFDIPDAPLGIVGLSIQAQGFVYLCEVVVLPGVVSELDPTNCVCKSEWCPALLLAACDVSLFDTCNCRDDDCDGAVDEDCFDACNCQDDNCDGVVDEDCSDGCDCLDNDCDGVVDEDCGATTSIPEFSSDFLSICEGSGICTDGSPLTACLPVATCSESNPVVGLELDCNSDGKPDQCPVCPLIELVVLVDISGSMEEEFFSLCETIPQLFDLLKDAGVTHSTEVYAMGSYWIPDAAAYPELAACLGSSLHKTYGPDVMPASITEVDSLRFDTEGWATAISAVAKNKRWAPDTLRLIVPISDEAPIWGDPFDTQDQQGIDFAADLCQRLGVTVAPLVGWGATADVHRAANQLAEKTNGLVYATGMATDLTAHALLTIVLTRCAVETDCDLNLIPDMCELDAQTDKNKNSIPDVCE